MLHRSASNFFAVILLTATACSNGSVSPSSTATISSALGRSSGKIQHIVIVMQEGRSFDNLFCGYQGADGKCARQTIPLEANCTLYDTFQNFEHDRKTGKFNTMADCPGYQRPHYAYVPSSELSPYYQLAQQYVLGDKMFSSTGNPTFEAHQYLIAAQSGAENEPYGKVSDGCVYHQRVALLKGGQIDACFSYTTLADELNAAGLTWSYYRTADPKERIVNSWDAYGWIKGGSSGTSPSSKFIQDVGSGKLSSVTWVTPAFADSDLSRALSCSGPSWVAAVVNAVGESQFWNTSAVVILWSGFGQWYDHVKPPYIDEESLGFRVPVLVVSPYARSGYVDHTQFETASALKFIEGTFGLAPLAASDSRANDFATSALDFHQQPRAFVPIQGGSNCMRR